MLEGGDVLFVGGSRMDFDKSVKVSSWIDDPSMGVTVCDAVFGDDAPLSSSGVRSLVSD